MLNRYAAASQALTICPLFAGSTFCVYAVIAAIGRLIDNPEGTIMKKSDILSKANWGAGKQNAQFLSDYVIQFPDVLKSSVSDYLKITDLQQSNLLPHHINTLSPLFEKHKVSDINLAFLVVTGLIKPLMLRDCQTPFHYIVVNLQPNPESYIQYQIDRYCGSDN